MQSVQQKRLLIAEVRAWINAVSTTRTEAKTMLARAAGISQGTMDRYLAGWRVKPETEEALLKHVRGNASRG